MSSNGDEPKPDSIPMKTKSPPETPVRKPASPPRHPAPEDEYGGGDIVSPELPDQTEDDKPLK
jgi:hypothetical protein